MILIAYKASSQAATYALRNLKIVNYVNRSSVENTGRKSNEQKLSLMGFQHSEAEVLESLQVRGQPELTSSLCKMVRHGEEWL